jgi:membrane fusion protein (multidrug efflux system)
MGKTVTEERMGPPARDEQQETGTTERVVGPPTQKRGQLPFVIIAGVTIACGVAIYWWMYLRGIVSTDDAQVEGHIHQISPRVPGVIVKVHVNDNQTVKAGQLLVELDPKDFEVIVAQQRAELASARAAVVGARTNVQVTDKNSASTIDQSKALVKLAEAFLTSLQKQVEQARADLKAREAQYKAAADEFAIREEMHSKSADTKLNLVVARNARDAGKALLERADAGLAVTLAQVGAALAGIQYSQARLRGAEVGPLQVEVAKEQTNQADAAVQKAEAALAQAELNLSYTNIVSPVDGVVSKKTAESGAHVVAGQPLMAIVPLQDTWVVANFKETQITHMKPGQKAVITVDAYPGRTFHGVVDSIAAGTGARFSLLPPENATGNFVKVVQRIPVKIRVERSGDGLDSLALRPGMNVIATVNIRGH